MRSWPCSSSREESVPLKGFADPISFVRPTPSPPASSRGERGPAHQRGEGEVGVSDFKTDSRCCIGHHLTLPLLRNGPHLCPASAPSQARRGGEDLEAS